MPVYSGKTGYVKLGAAQYDFDEWTLTTDTDIGKYFILGYGFQLTTDGMNKGVVELKGPHNVGSMAVVQGAVYTFHLGWTTGVELVVPARVSKNVRNVQAANSPPTVSISADTHGEFDANVA